MDELEPQKIQSNKLKVLLALFDFIPKCAPLIIVIYGIFLLNKIPSDDWLELFKKIEFIKVGGNEIHLYKQDQALQNADLNYRIVKIEEVLFKNSSTKISNGNSNYTVLVFHKEDNYTMGKNVVKNLTDKGYKSSSSETDFSEITKPEIGKIRILYTEKGKSILNEIKSLIINSNPNLESKIDFAQVELRRGDVQVLIF